MDPSVENPTADQCPGGVAALSEKCTDLPSDCQLSM
jgi:hypothetical protein